MEKNFIEVETEQDANLIDLTKYTFIGLKGECYCFKVRQRK